MRNNPTEPEKRLWNALKGSQLGGSKFRRQEVIGRRIVDFYCHPANLAVEVDGETHDPEQDRLRDAGLYTQVGVRVVRFTNDDVMRNLDGVLQRLSEILSGKDHPPTPSWQGGEK